MPEVSVIIPTYNRAHLMDRVIQTVLNQTFQDFELIIVDDASTDDTELVVKSFHDARIQYLRHKKNKGASATRNLGIKSSSGTYIAFLDSDDVWLPNKLEKQLDILRDTPKSLGVVYTGFETIKKTNKLVTYYPKYRGKIFNSLLTKNRVGNTSVVLIKKECLEKAGFFDEDLSIHGCEDWDMWIRISKHYNFDFVPEVLVRYYKQKDSISSDDQTNKIAHMTILNKYKGDIVQSSRKIRAEHYLYIGQIIWQCGDKKEGTKLFVNSLLSWPSKITGIFVFLFLYTGSQIKKILTHILHLHHT